MTLAIYDVHHNGHQWFWTAYDMYGNRQHGWHPDEDTAIDSAAEAAESFAQRARITGRSLNVVWVHDQAEAAQARLLANLKQAMAAAHPDRGGTSSGFIAARDQYEHARRQAGG